MPSRPRASLQAGTTPCTYGRLTTPRTRRRARAGHSPTTRRLPRRRSTRTRATRPRAASATFTFSADEGGSTVECDLDGAGFSSCSSPKSYSSLSDGSHTFKVKATDGAGNTDPTPAQYTWTVDTTSPSSATTFPGFGRGVQRPRLERGLRHRRLLRHVLGCDNGRAEGRDLHPARRGQLLERHRRSEARSKSGTRPPSRAATGRTRSPRPISPLTAATRSA